MTSTISAAANAAPGNECANPCTVSNPSKKRLRASSGSRDRPATALLSEGIRKKTDQTASANAPVTIEASNTVTEQPRQTKAAVVEALLTRERGASLEALCEATGWQAHTCRAFLTGLRKKGREVIRASNKDGKSIYLIAPDRLPAPPPEAEQAEAEGA
jgi:hypothetical protein